MHYAKKNDHFVSNKNGNSQQLQYKLVAKMMKLCPYSNSKEGSLSIHSWKSHTVFEQGLFTCYRNLCLCDSQIWGSWVETKIPNRTKTSAYWQAFIKHVLLPRIICNLHSRHVMWSACRVSWNIWTWDTKNVQAVFMEAKILVCASQSGVRWTVLLQPPKRALLSL